MNLVLTNDHLKEINGFIQKTPFEYAYPLFQYLTGLIQAQAQEEAAKQNVKATTAPKLKKVTDSE